MKKSFWLSLGVVGLVTCNAAAAFIAPTDEQLRQAAEDPMQTVVLIKEASVPQAADVIKNVIVHIIELNLPPDTRNSRIAVAVRGAIQSMPDEAQSAALAAALGAAVAASPTASKSPEVVSVIQQAVVSALGAAGGTAFGNAYNLAMQTIAGAPGGGKLVPPAPPPPPVAIPYEGQSLP